MRLYLAFGLASCPGTPPPGGAMLSGLDSSR
jgi:hypothetical protein